MFVSAWSTKNKKKKMCLYIHTYRFVLYATTRARARAHTPRYAQTSGNVVQSEWVNRIKYNGAHAHVYRYTSSSRLCINDSPCLTVVPLGHFIKTPSIRPAAQRWIAGVRPCARWTSGGCVLRARHDTIKTFALPKNDVFRIRAYAI